MIGKKAKLQKRLAQPIIPLEDKEYKTLSLEEITPEKFNDRFTFDYSMENLNRNILSIQNHNRLIWEQSICQLFGFDYEHLVDWQKIEVNQTFVELMASGKAGCRFIL